MKLLKSIAVAFSMYSRIPMPRFVWGSEDMKYHLIFFPWVGAVIGALEYGWYDLAFQMNINLIAYAIIAIIIPIIITGGFHLDGFMDTSDALASWGDKEKRLEILKDSHVGAFAVIYLIVLGLLMFACVYSMTGLHKAIPAWCFSFFMARTISGICVVKGKKAKSDGLLSTESETAEDGSVLICLALQFIGCCIIVNTFYKIQLTAMLVALLVAVIYYIYTAKTKFGGITGDLAGWFVCISELLMTIFLTVVCYFN